MKRLIYFNNSFNISYKHAYSDYCLFTINNGVQLQYIFTDVSKRFPYSSIIPILTESEEVELFLQKPHMWRGQSEVYFSLPFTKRGEAQPLLCWVLIRMGFYISDLTIERGVRSGIQNILLNVRTFFLIFYSQKRINYVKRGLAMAMCSIVPNSLRKFQYSRQ